MNKYLSSTKLLLILLSFVIILAGCSEVATPNEEEILAGDGVNGGITTLAITEDAINAIIQEVEALGLPHGIENALTKKLENAIKDLIKGNVEGAEDKIQSFIDQVTALTGKKISEAEADALIGLRIEVVKTATPSSIMEPGSDVTFGIAINNTSNFDAVTIMSLTDDIHGDLNNQGTCGVPQTIAVGDSYSCSFTVFVGGNAGDSETDTVTATGEDDQGNGVTNEGVAVVEIEDATPEIEVIVTAGDANDGEAYEIDAPRGAVEFHVSIENKSVTTDPVVITSLADDLLGDLNGNGQGDCVLPTIAPGDTYSCSFTAEVTGEIDEIKTNVVTASGVDDEGTLVSDSDGAEVAIIGEACDISVGANPIDNNADWTPVECDFDEGVTTTMVIVPAGSFEMGNDGAGGEQTIANPFLLDKTEVTQAAYKACVTSSACSPVSFANLDDDNPAEKVTSVEARLYCEWRGARLPTKKEWEYAARGPSNLIYPWGDNDPRLEPNPNPSSLLNYARQVGTTTPVGSYPDGASWVGALDMSGNVWEWTSSRAQNGGVEIRGGSFVQAYFAVRTFWSLGFYFRAREDYLGFRCVR